MDGVGDRRWQSRSSIGSRRMNIQELGTDNLVLIFSCLQPVSLACYTVVCTLWRIIIDLLLWRSICLRSSPKLNALQTDGATSHTPAGTGVDYRIRYVAEEQMDRQRHGRLNLPKRKAHAGRVNSCKMMMEEIASCSADKFWWRMSCCLSRTYGIAFGKRSKSFWHEKPSWHLFWRGEASSLEEAFSYRGTTTCMHNPTYLSFALAVGGSDETINVFGADFAKSIAMLDARSWHFGSPTLGIALSMTKLISCHADSTMIVWKLPKNCSRQTREGGTKSKILQVVQHELEADLIESNNFQGG